MDLYICIYVCNFFTQDLGVVNHVKCQSDFFCSSEDLDNILFMLYYIVVPRLIICLCYLTRPTSSTVCGSAAHGADGNLQNGASPRN